MNGNSNVSAGRPNNYKYRGKTSPNNGEKLAKVKYTLLETLLKGTNLDNNPAFMQEIQPFFKPDQLSREYTLENYFEIMDRACDWLFPNLSREQGREEIGRMFLNGLRRTVFGRIALSGMHLMKSGQMLMLSPYTLGSMVSYGQRSVKELGPKHYLFSSRGVAGTCEEQVGALKQALQETGAKNIRCTVQLLTPNDWDYVFEWD